MKNKDLEIIYKIFDKIPKSLPLEIKEKILRNKSVISSEISFLKDLISVCSEEEIQEIMFRSFVNCNDIVYINIEELPDNINEFESEFLEGLFLLIN